MKRVVVSLLAFAALLSTTPALAGGWLYLTLPETTGSEFTGVSFYDNAGVAVTSRDVLYTTDYGSTWTAGDLDTSNTQDVVMVSEEVAVTVGSFGNIERSTDGGASWTQFDSGTAQTLRAVDSDGDTLLAVGNDGAVMRSSDAGLSWTDVSFGETRDFHDVDMLSATEAYLVGESGMAYWWSTDFGWFEIDPATSYDLYTVDATGGSQIWIAGEGEYLASIDLGDISWTQVTPDERDVTAEIDDILFTSSTDGSITRAGGCLWQTADGGATWTEVADTCANIYTEFAYEGGTLFTIGYVDGGDKFIAVYDESLNEDSGEEEEPVYEPEPEEPSEYAGQLIKTACSTGYEVNDPCTAVYYVADDGMRHAFPNEKVYYSWYSDFDDVVIVDATTMASFALGWNVTYKPGVTMVKFQSLNNVYAVEEGSVLRHVESESVAASLYGSDWNTADVDDISDAFYGNYSFGGGINSADDYDVDAVLTGTPNIDDNF